MDDLDNVDERLMRRFAELSTVATAVQCARWMRDQVPADRRRAVAVGWAVRAGHAGRGLVESDHEVDRHAAGLTDADTDLIYAAVVYHGSKLHAARRLDQLARFLDASPLVAALGPLREDPMVLALSGAARLAHPGDDRWDAVELLARAWAGPGRTLEVIDICLSALDDAPEFEGKYELLARYGAEAAELYPDDPLIHYHWSIGASATATGPADHEAALAVINRAPLLPTRPRTDELDRRAQIAAFLQRRNLIADRVHRDREAAEHEQRWLDQLHHAEARAAVSTRRLVALVVAPLVVVAVALAFIAGSAAGSAGPDTATLGDRIGQIALLGVALLVFTVLLLAATRAIVRRQTSR